MSIFYQTGHFRTKIVCTMGPAVNSAEKIEALVLAGMHVARLNFSHGSYEEHGEIIHLLKEVRRKLGVPLSIMLDTKGPELRLGKLKNNELTLHKGQRLWLVKEPVEGDAERISLNPASVLEGLQEGVQLLLDNGYILTHVIAIAPHGVQIEVDHGGTIKSTRGVNVPHLDLELPALTEKDIADICFGCSHDIDWIAASFIRSAEHVLSIKKILKEQNRPEIGVIAKIENRLGVHNFETIVRVADGIMVARGDLGVELSLTQVPRLQKMMIRQSSLFAKPCVTATQMLESMIWSPRPTRAEASDVANAIYDSTSAVMLSGETAIGAYPVQTVRMMREIIEEAEKDFPYRDFFKKAIETTFYDVPSAVALASVSSAYSTHAKAIFAFTTSGSTARLLSRLRPEIPILAMTPHEKVYHQLALSWGVIPLLCKEAQTIQEARRRICRYALEKAIVKSGDLVVITTGTPFGCEGSTNTMTLETVS